MTSAPRATVAIVDDDAGLLASLAELFESCGFAALTFLSASDFLASGALERVEAIVSDIGLSGLDGFRLRSFVRSQRPGMPVILVTGRYELIERLAPAERMDGSVFRKPFDGGALVAAVAVALTRLAEEGVADDRP